MKTTEQSAHEYALSCRFKSDYPHSLRSAEDGFQAGVEFAQRWISVDDELPEIEKGSLDSHRYSKKVLVKDEKGNVHISCMVSYKSHAREWNCTCKVTHWRPIELK